MLNVADTQTIFLSVEGETFNMAAGTVLSDDRTLNMDRGFTERGILWKSPGGKSLEITIKRMAHLDRPNLFTQEYRVKAHDFGGRISLTSCDASRF